MLFRSIADAIRLHSYYPQAVILDEQGQTATLQQLKERFTLHDVFQELALYLGVTPPPAMPKRKFLSVEQLRQTTYYPNGRRALTILRWVIFGSACCFGLASLLIGLSFASIIGVPLSQAMHVSESMPIFPLLLGLAFWGVTITVFYWVGVCVEVLGTAVLDMADRSHQPD